MQMKKLSVALAFAGLAGSGSALATNGMLVEGYGPIALGMGGASMAYDNGTAAMMNNPATLGLMAEGSRFDLALGFLGPDVSSDSAGLGTSSSADAFYMPAVGYVKKSGNLTYGVGVFGQGGMGSDWTGAGGRTMAQVSIGRLIFPVAYNVNKQLTVGGSIDYVWSGMDLVFGPLDFEDSSDFTGKAKGDGVAAKIGFTYQVNDQLTVGGTYHTEGGLSDLSGGGARVQGFDMPPIAALGLSFKPNDKMMVALDVREIMWSETMKTVTMIQGATVPFQQDWDDQTVYQLGVSYKFSDALTGRIGASFSDNPIPNQFVSHLWPATTEDHYMVGFGYSFDKDSELNFALSYAPEVTVTNPDMYGMGPVSVKHSQTNFQIMYSKKF